MMPLDIDFLKKTTLSPVPKRSGQKTAQPHPTFSPLLAQFDPIGLSQMAGVALLDRMDTKYVMSEQQLYRALTTLTLDFNLRFFNDAQSVSLPGVAIAEVKQAGHNPHSPFFQQILYGRDHVIQRSQNEQLQTQTSPA